MSVTVDVPVTVGVPENAGVAGVEITGGETAGIQYSRVKYAARASTMANNNAHQ